MRVKMPFLSSFIFTSLSPHTMCSRYLVEQNGQNIYKFMKNKEKVMLMSRVLLEISDLNLRDCNGLKVKTDHEDGGKKINFFIKIFTSSASPPLLQ